jgi:hypothetical protein
MISINKVEKVFPYILLAIITAILSFFVVYNANWLFGDDFEFMITTAVGKIEWKFHIANEGRFNPFCHFDFNVLTLLPYGTTVTAHYCLVALSMIVFVVTSVFLYKIILENSSKTKQAHSWLVLLIIVFLLYYFLTVFFLLDFPERIIVVLMTIFMILYYRLITTNYWGYAVAALIIAIYLTYVKEPVFVVFAVISVLNLLFNYKNITNTQKLFYWLLIADGFVFLVLYYIISYRKTEHFYTTSSDSTQILYFTLHNLKVLYAGLILAIIRIIKILFCHDREYLFYDSLLFIGLVYALSCIVLNLQSVYYYFPAVVLSFPSLIFWMTKYIHPKWVSLIMLVIVLYYGRKFPESIKSIQNMRVETPRQMKKLTGYISQGYQMYWVQNERLSDPVILGRQKYQQKVLKIYVNYIDKTLEQITFKTIDTQHYSIPERSLLFYSDFNIIDSKDKYLWLERMRKEEACELDMDQIWKLSGYIK